MKSANLVRFAQVAVFALLFASITFAQTPQPKPIGQATTKAQPNAPDPLKLTDAELAELVELSKQQREVANTLQAKINAVLTVTCDACDKDALLLAAAKAANEFFIANAKPLSQRIDARIAELQRAHGCEGCQLKDGAFVRPEGKAK